MARPAALKTLSVADLQREINRRQGALGGLMRKRRTLAKRLAALDAKIASMGGSVSGDTGRRTRPKNDGNLLEALVKVLKGKTMSVTEVAEAVQKAGYQTTSVNFRTIVNQNLLKKKYFKRVERGMYTAV